MIEAPTTTGSGLAPGQFAIMESGYCIVKSAIWPGGTIRGRMACFHWIQRKDWRMFLHAIPNFAMPRPMENPTDPFRQARREKGALVSEANVLLKTFAAVRALTTKEATEERPVSCEAIVICLDPIVPKGIILHDGSAGCYAHCLRSPRGEEFRPGDRVRIKGVTRTGSFFPDIARAEIDLISHGELPEPRAVEPSDLFSRWVDSEWVEVEAVIVATETGGLAYTLVIEVAGQIFKADVPDRPDADRLVGSLIQKKVRLRGVVATVFNEDSQLAGRHFYIPSMDQIIPVEPDLPASPPPLRLIKTLLRNDHGLEDLVRLRGVITSAGVGGFYLRDKSGSTFVHTIQGEAHPPGSKVEVVGYAAVAPFRPIFRAAATKLLDRGSLPSAVDFDSGDKSRWTALHSELICVACEFVSDRDGLTGPVLQCCASGIFFEALLENEQYELPGLQPGDRLSLTGILEVTTTRPIPRQGWVDGFRVHLVSPAPVKIISKAPWWTPARILATLRNWQLRRLVDRQAFVISHQAKLATVRDERQRIARELHDTLEQELTGLSMQLGNVSAEIGMEDGPARRSLTLAQRMLQHCRLEARASVSDLRNPSLLAQDLPGILRETLAMQVDGNGATLEFGTTGTPMPLRASTENHLLRIAREAVGNALRHGKASQVSCRLAYSEQGVALEIEDNGCGFDSSQPPPTGHFGLTGMRERANKIHAQFALISRPGSGAKIGVYLPCALQTPL